MQNPIFRVGSLLQEYNCPSSSSSATNINSKMGEEKHGVRNTFIFIFMFITTYLYFFVHFQNRLKSQCGHIYGYNSHDNTGSSAPSTDFMCSQNSCFSYSGDYTNNYVTCPLSRCFL